MESPIRLPQNYVGYSEEAKFRIKLVSYDT